MTKPTKTYLFLTLLTTLATSLIWGVDTIFLLNSGLTNAQVFLVNSGFMVGQLLFEIPTGVIADTWGRRLSFLIGCLWLAVSTGLYCWLGVMHAQVWAFALASASLGVGYTFFSGATEAWLVDELKQLAIKGELERALGLAQSVGGVAMLIGAVSGGFIAEWWGLPMAYVLRASLLVLSFGVGAVIMTETGFKPQPTENKTNQFATTLKAAVQVIKTQPTVWWLVAAAPFTTAVGYYTFYAAQPFLLQLYGDPTAYAVAGSAAALVALSRVVGGTLVAKLPLYRYSAPTLLASALIVTAVTLGVLGTTNNFWVAIAALWVWGLMFAMIQPIRQTFLNQYIPSAQRATVLSMDSLVGSIGGAVLQPGLGWIADTRSYGQSFLAGALGMIAAVPLTWLAGLTTSQKKA